MADAPQTPHPQIDVAASDIVSSGGFGIPGADWGHVGCAACGGHKVVGCEPWHILIPCPYSRKASDDLHELNRVDPPAQRWARFCAQHNLPNIQVSHTEGRSP
jgi:hypothetical protein